MCWQADPEVLRFDAAARGKAARPFLLRIPESIGNISSRLAICAEVTVDGRHLGQIAEAIVNLVG